MIGFDDGDDRLTPSLAENKVFHNSLQELKMRFCININTKTNKKTCPCIIMPGQVITCGATLLGASSAPTHHVLTYADPVHGRSDRLTYSTIVFLLALKSPFSLILSVAISPSAALFEIRDNAYSLFVFGFGFFNLAVL